MKKNKANKLKQWHSGREVIIPQIGQVVLDKRGNRYVIKGVGVNRLYVYREAETPNDVVTAKLSDMFPIESDAAVTEDWESKLRRDLENVSK